MVVSVKIHCSLRQAFLSVRVSGFLLFISGLFLLAIHYLQSGIPCISGGAVLVILGISVRASKATALDSLTFSRCCCKNLAVAFIFAFIPHNSPSKLSL